MTGVPHAEFEHAVCESKRFTAHNETQAANLAYLMAQSLHQRTAAYRCSWCCEIHVSTRRLDGRNALVCSWPGAR